MPKTSRSNGAASNGIHTGNGETVRKPQLVRRRFGERSETSSVFLTKCYLRDGNRGCLPAREGRGKMIHAHIDKEKAIPLWALIGAPLVGVPLMVALLALRMLRNLF